MLLTENVLGHSTLEMIGDYIRNLPNAKNTVVGVV